MGSDLYRYQSHGGSYADPSLAPFPGGTSASSSTLDFFMEDVTLVDGNRVDGWWEGQAVLPRGVPVGSYYQQVWVDDIGHLRSHVSELSDSNPGNLKVPGDSVVVVAEHVG